MKSVHLGVAIVLGLSGLLVMGALAQARTHMTKAQKNEQKNEQKNAAKHASDRTAVVQFDKGSADLTANGQDVLRALVNRVGVSHIDRVDVAAWSDHAFPKAGADLPKEDRDLADARGTAVNDFLKNQLMVSSMNIKNFNMSETSNWLARAMRTEDAELKSMFGKDQNAPIERRDFDTIAKEGAPQRAVVVVVRKAK